MLFSFKFSLYVVCASLFITNASCWRIVGGRPSQEGEFPYQVSLRRSYNDEHFCGGSIITPLHILTAGHCMFYRWGGVLPPIVVSVVAGQLDLPIAENSVYRNASKITIHEDIDLESLANDLAVIELDEALPIDSNKLLDIIPMRETSTGSGKCVVSGWGYEEHESGIISEVLLAAEVDIINYTICTEKYANAGIELFEGMLCAGLEQGGKDACQGDSGGPLVCDGLLTGVVSTGEGCGEADFPGIYSDVAKFLPWIQNIILTATTPSTPATTADATTPTITSITTTTVASTAILNTSNDYTETESVSNTVTSITTTTVASTAILNTTNDYTDTELVSNLTENTNAVTDITTEGGAAKLFINKFTVLLIFILTLKEVSII